jgi:hypothetical protein
MQYLAAVLVTLLVVTLIAAGVFLMSAPPEDEVEEAETDAEAEAEVEDEPEAEVEDEPEAEVEAETPQPLTCEEGQVESEGECMTVTYETKENMATYGRPIKRLNHSENTLENAKDVCTMDTTCNYIVDYPRTRKQYLLLSTKNKDRGRKGVTTYVKTLTA